MKTEYENEARKSFTMLLFSELVFAVRLVSVRLKKKIGNSVTTNFEVVEISGADGKWTISDGKCDKQFEKIVSTIPIQILMKAIDAPPKIKEAANSL
jgi:protoporphyrinogen oxidase